LTLLTDLPSGPPLEFPIRILHPSLLTVSDVQCRRERGEGKAVLITGARRSEMELGARIWCICFDL